MNNLKLYRVKAGVTQTDLADAIGLTQGAVSHYEAGRRLPTLDDCRLIVGAFNKMGINVTLDDVFPPKQRVA